MPKVTFLPLNVTVEANEGESILDVALNHDVPLQHACGGFCSCTTCQIEVQDGPEGLSPMEEDETERLESVGQLKPAQRLGCQARVLKGSITVKMVNVDD